MLKLEAFEVCPITSVCEYRVESFDSRTLCGGCDPQREIVFICDCYMPKDNLMLDVSECLKGCYK